MSNKFQCPRCKMILEKTEHYYQMASLMASAKESGGTVYMLSQGPKCPGCGTDWDREALLSGKYDVHELYTSIGEPEVPLIKQGPTSQNQGGCFIATAACGSALEPEVTTLRVFRDFILRRWAFGRIFIRMYEGLAPPFAEWIEHRANARRMVRLLIIRPCAAILSRTVLRAQSLSCGRAK